jgi:hypothetical protein
MDMRTDFETTQPFGTEACLQIFQNSVRTAKTEQHFALTKIKWLRLFKEIIVVYS